MPKIKINKDRCKGCYLCVSYCPKGLITIDSELNKLGVKPVKFQNKKGVQCIGCAFCALICPDCGIEVIKE